MMGSVCLFACVLGSQLDGGVDVFVFGSQLDGGVGVFVLGCQSGEFGPGRATIPMNISD